MHRLKNRPQRQALLSGTTSEYGPNETSKSYADNFLTPEFLPFHAKKSLQPHPPFSTPYSLQPHASLRPRVVVAHGDGRAHDAHERDPAVRRRDRRHIRRGDAAGDFVERY